MEFHENKWFNCGQLLNKYKDIRILSDSIYNVINSELNEESIIKIIEDYRIEEAQISQILSNVPGFIKLKNWFICNSRWSQPSDFPLLYLEMEKADGILTDLRNLTLLDIKCILFEIIAAYNVSYNTYGFCHWDVHLSNILYKKEVNPRIYEYDNREFIISSKYTPLISDFGTSTIGTYKSCQDHASIIKIIKYFASKYTEYRFEINVLLMSYNPSTSGLDNYSNWLHSTFFQDLYRH